MKWELYANNCGVWKREEERGKGSEDLKIESVGFGKEVGEKGGSGTKRKGERGSGAGNELNFAGGMVGGSRLSRGDKRSKRDINSRGV